MSAPKTMRLALVALLASLALAVPANASEGLALSFGASAGPKVTVREYQHAQRLAIGLYLKMLRGYDVSQVKPGGCDLTPGYQHRWFCTVRDSLKMFVGQKKPGNVRARFVIHRIDGRWHRCYLGFTYKGPIS